jgi:hypothetical protein
MNSSKKRIGIAFLRLVKITSGIGQRPVKTALISCYFAPVDP